MTLKDLARKLIPSRKEYLEAWQELSTAHKILIAKLNADDFQESPFLGGLLEAMTMEELRCSALGQAGLLGRIMRRA